MLRLTCRRRRRTWARRLPSWRCRACCFPELVVHCNSPSKQKKRQNLHLFQLGSLLLGFCLGLLRLESASHPDNFFALKKKHEHRTFFSDTMGGRKKYIPLEITQKGSSFKVQSLSWTALLFCALRFNNMIGAGAARLSLFGLAAVPVTVKSYIWTFDVSTPNTGKISNSNRLDWNIVQGMEFVHWSFIACVLCVNGAATCAWTERNKYFSNVCSSLVGFQPLPAKDITNP